MFVQKEKYTLEAICPQLLKVKRLLVLGLEGQILDILEILDILGGKGGVLFFCLAGCLCVMEILWGYVPKMQLYHIFSPQYKPDYRQISDIRRIFVGN